MTLSGGGSDMSGQTALAAEDVDIDVVGEGDDAPGKDGDGEARSPAALPRLPLDEAAEPGEPGAGGESGSSGSGSPAPAGPEGGRGGGGGGGGGWASSR